MYRRPKALQTVNTALGNVCSSDTSNEMSMEMLVSLAVTRTMLKFLMTDFWPYVQNTQ